MSTPGSSLTTAVRRMVVRRPLDGEVRVDLSVPVGAGAPVVVATSPSILLAEGQLIEVLIPDVSPRAS